LSFEIINPEALGAPKGWNHGMLAPRGGRTLFVAGQVASDETGRIVGGEVAAPWERALENVLQVVRAAGGGPQDIARMTVFVTDRDAYLSALKPLGRVWRRQMGRHYPAVAVVEVKGLVEPGAVVEIEATAVIPD
jgi:enamine deaminase RidA (YjgF/YER057c/UK114 family)